MLDNGDIARMKMQEDYINDGEISYYFDDIYDQDDDESLILTVAIALLALSFILFKQIL